MDHANDWHFLRRRIEPWLVATADIFGISDSRHHEWRNVGVDIQRVRERVVPVTTQCSTGQKRVFQSIVDTNRDFIARFSNQFHLNNAAYFDFSQARCVSYLTDERMRELLGSGFAEICGGTMSPWKSRENMKSKFAILLFASLLWLPVWMLQVQEPVVTNRHRVRVLPTNVIEQSPLACSS